MNQANELPIALLPGSQGQAVRAQAIAGAGSLACALEQGLLPAQLDLSLSEALVLGLLKQGVSKYLAIFGHGSTDLGEVLRNSYDKRLVEGRIGIDPEADIPRACVAIATVVQDRTRELNVPAPLVGIEAFEDDMIVIGYRYWANSQRYFETLYAVNNDIHAALDAEHIHLASRRLISGADGH